MKPGIMLPLVALIASALLVSCDEAPEAARAAATPDPAATPELQPPYITATPNPIPGTANPGKTTIQWNTGGSSGAVFVAENMALFSIGSEGSQEADWINTDSETEFLLYEGQDKKNLLGRVVVKGAGR